PGRVGGLTGRGSGADLSERAGSDVVGKDLNVLVTIGIVRRLTRQVAGETLKRQGGAVVAEDGVIGVAVAAVAGGVGTGQLRRARVLLDVAAGIEVKCGDENLVVTGVHVIAGQVRGVAPVGDDQLPVVGFRDAESFVHALVGGIAVDYAET